MVDNMIRLWGGEFDGMYVGDIALFDGYFLIRFLIIIIYIGYVHFSDSLHDTFQISVAYGLSASPTTYSVGDGPLWLETLSTRGAVCRNPDTHAEPLRHAIRNSKPPFRLSSPRQRY
jgi:hypothetical protein